MSRPKKKIRAGAVYELARIGATQEEMGRVLGCDATTIGRRFSGEIKRGAADLKIKLRRKQISAALNGNVSLLIWLGKQLLDQTDRSRTELSGEIENSAALSLEELDARLRKLLQKAGYTVESDFDGTDRARIPVAVEGETEQS
jgi:hypothetical protein